MLLEIKIFLNTELRARHVKILGRRLEGLDISVGLTMQLYRYLY